MRPWSDRKTQYLRRMLGWPQDKSKCARMENNDMIVISEKGAAIMEMISADMRHLLESETLSKLANNYLAKEFLKKVM